MQMPKAPLAAISSRVKVFLSITTAMRGGVNSTGIDQAAAITLRRPPCALVTSTVGPWLTRRLACSRATGRKWVMGHLSEQGSGRGPRRTCDDAMGPPSLQRHAMEIEFK